MRDEPSAPDHHRVWAIWESEYLHSSVWASVIGRWEVVDRLATYPHDDIRVDIDQSKENRAWLLLLAKAIRDGGLYGGEAHLEAIRTGRRKREKLLLAVLLEILAGSREATEKNFLAYFKHYSRSENKGTDLFTTSMYDGTLLYKLAHRRRLKLSFPPEFMERVIRLRDGDGLSA